MKLVFIRPLVESGLGVMRRTQDMGVRYKFPDGVISKDSEAVYSVNDTNSCIDWMLSLLNILECLPIYICEDDDEADKAVEWVRRIFNNMEFNDVLWVSALTRKYEDEVTLSTYFNNLDNKLYLRNGKYFLRSTTIEPYLKGVRPLNYRLMTVLVDSITIDEVCNNKEIKNKAKAIVNAICTFQSSSMQYILESEFGIFDFIDEGYKWQCYRVSDDIHVYTTMDRLIDDLTFQLTQDIDAMDSVSYITGSKDNLALGTWSVNDGTRKNLDSNMAFMNYMSEIESNCIGQEMYYVT